jgi:hypothetical protein
MYSVAHSRQYADRGSLAAIATTGMKDPAVAYSGDFRVQMRSDAPILILQHIACDRWLAAEQRFIDRVVDTRAPS